MNEQELRTIEKRVKNNDLEYTETRALCAALREAWKKNRAISDACLGIVWDLTTQLEKAETVIETVKMRSKGKSNCPLFDRDYCCDGHGAKIGCESCSAKMARAYFEAKAKI